MNWPASCSPLEKLEAAGRVAGAARLPVPMPISVAEASKIDPPAKAAKYRNKVTFVDGIRFASKKESVRYGQLLLLEMAGKIRDLERQVSFDLEVNGVLIGRYTCDFTYVEDGLRVVEDVKSPSTRKNRAYRLRVKLMLACHDITIRET